MMRVSRSRSSSPWSWFARHRPEGCKRYPRGPSSGRSDGTAANRGGQCGWVSRLWAITLKFDRTIDDTEIECADAPGDRHAAIGGDTDGGDECPNRLSASCVRTWPVGACLPSRSVRAARWFAVQAVANPSVSPRCLRPARSAAKTMRGRILLHEILGRPRGRRVDSSPRRCAVRITHRSVPNGRPRCRHSRSASSSVSSGRRLTISHHRRGRCTGQSASRSCVVRLTRQ